MDWAALRGIALFAGLDETALKRIAALATEFEAPAGQVLAERGQPGSGLLVIESGEITVEFPDGRLIEYGPGDFFGEVSLLTDEPRTARVRSQSPVRGIAISRSEFFELLDQEPRMAVAMLPVIARRLANAN
jgi:CRP/FNR family cyclic AMP-dependent transcriptional regulator